LSIISEFLATAKNNDFQCADPKDGFDDEDKNATRIIDNDIRAQK